MVAFSPNDILARVARAPNVSLSGRSLGVVSSFGAGATIKSAGRGKVMVSVMLTTSDLDMSGERIMPKGMNVDKYLKPNGKWFVDHQYDFMSCVGDIRSIYPQDNGLLANVILINLENNPYSQAVEAMVREAGKVPASIGFEEEDAGTPTPDELKKWPGTERIIRSAIALEGSFTCIPCNVACQSRAITYGDDSKAADMREILVKARIPGEVIKAMFPEAKPKRRVVLCE